MFLQICVYVNSSIEVENSTHETRYIIHYYVPLIQCRYDDYTLYKIWWWRIFKFQLTCLLRSSIILVIWIFFLPIVPVFLLSFVPTLLYFLLLFPSSFLFPQTKTPSSALTQFNSQTPASVPAKYTKEVNS